MRVHPRPPFIALATALVAMLATLGPARTPAAEPAPRFLHAIAPGVYVHLGQYADIDVPARGDSANLGVVSGSRCTAVIDTGGALATGRALRDALVALRAAPLCYVVNTHVHFDHVLGNGALTATGVEFIGQAHLADEIAASREFFAENFAAELDGAGHADAVIAPTRGGVEKSLDLDLGGRTLHLVAVATAHSTSDLTVTDSASGTFFTGDLVFRERLPVLDGDLKGWLAWLDEAMTVPHAIVVPGHGPVDTAWPVGAQAEHAYLAALLRDTRAAIARGATMEDAQATVATGEAAHWQVTARAQRLNVSRAFRQLEWE